MKSDIFAYTLAGVLAFTAGLWSLPQVRTEALHAPIMLEQISETDQADSSFMQEPYVPESSTGFEDPISSQASLVYFFYKDTCPFCRELEPLLGGLPAWLTLPDGTRSEVNLVCLNKLEESMLEVITEYYKAYDIPEEKQYVPAVVIGDRYLFTGEEIIDGLMDSLVAGDGLSTPLLNGTERKD